MKLPSNPQMMKESPKIETYLISKPNDLLKIPNIVERVEVIAVRLE